MKRRFILFFTLCFLSILCCCPVLAVNHVPEMELEVALRPDGSAYITQTWYADADEGTEFYLERWDSGYLTITDFSVSDEKGPFTFVENWDVKASFAEKARKCGIVETDKGVELCWGISQYGQNRYTVEYILHDLVGAYSDADGFNHCFLNDMSTFPTDVTLTILNQDGTPLTDSGCDIWAFGYDGQIQFENGVIRAWSETPLKQGDYMTIMVRFEKGVLSPLRSADGSFEAVKERAFKGSDYDNSSTSIDPLTLILGLLSLPAFILIFAVAVFIDTTINRAKLNKRMKKVNYFRDIPNKGNLNLTYYLGLSCDLFDDDTLLGAYLLRLISQGCLEPVTENPEDETACLRLSHSPKSGDTYDNTLYSILEAAAGADGTLQPSELEAYCKQNEAPLVSFLTSCRKDSEQSILRLDCFKKPDGDGLKNFTPAGLEQLDEILGLKRFLLDFSLIQERGIQDAVLWQDYMVYAMLLGIADTVTSQIKAHYPAALPQVERYEVYLGYSRHYNRRMRHAYSKEYEQRQAARSGGHGGRASRRGGRGSSGGGRGGSR